MEQRLESSDPHPLPPRRISVKSFETDMNRLYRLSFLLTGDDPTAEQCFIGGLQMKRTGNPIFPSRGRRLGAANDHSGFNSSAPPAIDRGRLRVLWGGAVRFREQIELKSPRL